MSKLDEKVALYTASAEKLRLGLSADLITKATKGLGPSIYNKDSETVACGNAAELETVKKNFLQKKLGLSDDAAMDATIQKVCEAMGKSNAHKYRALFYAMLAKEFGKESVYA